MTGEEARTVLAQAGIATKACSVFVEAGRTLLEEIAWRDRQLTYLREQTPTGVAIDRGHFDSALADYRQAFGQIVDQTTRIRDSFGDEGPLAQQLELLERNTVRALERLEQRHG